MKKLIALLVPAFVAVSTCGRLPVSPYGLLPPRFGHDGGARFSPPEPTGAEALERLRALGVDFRPYRPGPARRGLPFACGLEEGVEIRRGPTGVRYGKPLHTSAAFALRVVRFEAVVQEEAQRVFGEPVRRIEHYGTYSCRPIAGTTAIASQHAAGNAIDVAGFVLRSGRRVSVLRDFARAGTTPVTPGAQFLDGLVRRLAERRVFGVMLTPDFDRRHANHLHFDGTRRSWGWAI